MPRRPDDRVVVRFQVNQQPDQTWIQTFKALIERGIADAHDQHVDSMAVTPEPFARLTQHTDATASGMGLDRGLSLRSTDGLPGW
jgi:hypothetical protein